MAVNIIMVLSPLSDWKHNVFTVGVCLPVSLSLSQNCAHSLTGKLFKVSTQIFIYILIKNRLCIEHKNHAFCIYVFLLFPFEFCLLQNSISFVS